MSWQRPTCPCFRARQFSKHVGLYPSSGQAPSRSRSVRLRLRRSVLQKAVTQGWNHFEIKDWLKQIFCQISVSEQVHHESFPHFSQIKMRMSPRTKITNQLSFLLLSARYSYAFIRVVMRSLQSWQYRQQSDTLLRKQVSFVYREIKVKK